MLEERDLKDKEENEAFYEAQILSTPANSYVWIHFISFMYKKFGIAESRKVSERALVTINMTEIAEKLNIWIAYMNLEFSYGDESKFQELVKRAIKFNEPKDIYLAMISIYQKNGRYNIIEGIYKLLIKKYGADVSIFEKYLEYVFEAKYGDSIDTEEISEPRAILSRGLQSLTRNEQVQLISKFGMLEYRFGNLESGRTMLNSIISSYKKSKNSNADNTEIKLSGNKIRYVGIYLDMEIKFGNKSTTRQLFDRLLRREKIKLPHLKYIFKRYLEYEMAHGTEKDVERVKEKAQEMVAKMTENES